MKRLGSFFCFAIVVSAIAVMVSCKSSVAEEQQIIDVTGTWCVDSVITQVYPTDSVVKTYFSDFVRQKVCFGEDGSYRTTVWQGDSVCLDLKLSYKLSGDTLSYCMEDVRDEMLELVESCSDSVLVTRSILLYSDRSADLNTVYYSRERKELKQVRVD